MGILQGWRGDGMCWRSMWDGLSWVVRGCREQYLTHGSKLPHFGHCLETILTSSDGINEITGRDWALLLGHGGFGIERGGGVPHLIKTQNTAKNLLPVYQEFPASGLRVYAVICSTSYPWNSYINLSGSIFNQSRCQLSSNVLVA